MRMLIDILKPYPPDLNESYVPFGYHNFGLCCWVYSAKPIPNTGNGTGQYDGAVEWINTAHFVTEPKYKNVLGFRCVLLKGCSGYITPDIQVSGAPLDVIINGILTNPATGAGMPLAEFALLP